MKRNSYIVFLQLLNGEFCLHQVVVEDDDLSAQRALLIVMVLRLIKKKKKITTIHFFQLDLDVFWVHMIESCISVFTAFICQSLN